MGVDYSPFDTMGTVEVRKPIPTSATQYGFQITVSDQISCGPYLFDWYSRVRDAFIKRGEDHGMMIVGDVQVNRIPELIHNDMLKLQKTYYVTGQFVPIPKTIH